MRIPVSWLASHLELPEGTTPEQLADAFVRIGLEVEDVHTLGPVTGPLLAGRVAHITELTEFKKPIRFCQVEIGEDKPRGIICGATNFAEGDTVVVALPGCVLPGDFTITARKTYGHVSDGMICSLRELGLGEEHSGILVLPPGEAEAGHDAHALLGLDDSVIELAVTPDRGYALSARGLAREIACALEVRFADPASLDVGPADGEAWPVHIEDRAGCSRFVARRVSNVDAGAPSPWWLRRRLLLAGMRPISLAVDVTNYVMLELGQPLHAYDASKLTGNITVRRAAAGEKLATLDGNQRALDPDDLVVCDESGPIGLGGVMGGASTEIGGASSDIVIEAANWDPRSIARSVRRHRLPSEAAKRFERTVDPALPPAAAELAARLLQQYGEATIQPGRTDVGSPELPKPITIPFALPDRVAGVIYERGATAKRLAQIGCQIDVGTAEDGQGVVVATPPTWRSDLTQPADLVEEVLRLEGYDSIPSALPVVRGAGGLTEAQRRKRAVARSLAAGGYVEVEPFPFVASSTWDAFGLAADDVRRHSVKVQNPLEADRPELATTLLPGLIDALHRNLARGHRDLALFHIGQVVLPKAQQIPVPEVGVTGRPSEAELASLLASLPQQPVHVAALLAGYRERPGWWGNGRQAAWSDAVEAARVVARAAGVELRVVASDLAPWHPGRCAELRVGDWPVGHAGELHPKVVEALGLPKRACAMEIDLDALPLKENRPAPVVSSYPPVLLDIALVVDASVPAGDLMAVLRGGGGDLLEDIRLFDVYAGEQVGEGKRSLAFSLRFRAPDRTLTLEEATTARDAAVAVATERLGATLRA